MSLFRDFYYDVKPFLPLRLRMAARRAIARIQLQRSRDQWPIDPAAGTTPKNWPGWPNGKQFAFVLTHDVEGPRGLANCEALMQLEMELGFRSSFNFVPEGSYKVPEKFLSRLVENGFEVGVHDLHHNGKLYRNKKRFDAAAPRINHYLREWNAVGFRSGFMHRNLDWLHALDIEYDMSTFDTDPFEPQPDGVHTIFPFWVPAPDHSTLNHQPITSHSALSAQSGTLRTSNFELRTSRRGYVELPYTLPQDSTLFLLLNEPDCTIWKRKLDWIAENGGMALLNVHPDYVNFSSSRRDLFPAGLYREFLQYVKTAYGDSARFMLPSEVSSFVKGQYAGHGLRGNSDRSQSIEIGSRRKRIAMVSYSFYESDNRVMRYAEALASRGDSVDVFALAKRKTLPAEEKLSGVKLRRLQMRERNEKGKFDYLSRTLRFLLRSSFTIAWRHLFRRYDIIHVHNVPDFLVFAAWFPALTGARVILDIHDVLPEFFASKFSSESSDTKYFNALVRLERMSCGFADHVIISNHLWYDKITQRSVAPRKTSVILNYVDPEIFNRRERTRNDDRLIAIFPGGLQEHQGLDIAIRAFALIISSFPTAEFHIYGEGNMKATWVQLARELNVERHVFFFEPLPIREIVQKVADADVGLVPKRADSFGNEAYSTKIMEFMSQGIPVVAARTKIDTFYFSDDLITFFNSGDPADLAAKITSVFRDRKIASERVARSLKHVAENSWAVRKHEYLALVDQLAGVKPERTGMHHAPIEAESRAV